MSKFNNANNFQTVIELLYEEIKTFRTEHKEEYRHLEEIITNQSAEIGQHSEQLVKLIHTVHGNGNKGLVERIDLIEKKQTEFAEKFENIETKEKIKAAILGLICTVCSALGGIIAYAISIYSNLNK